MMRHSPWSVGLAVALVASAGPARAEASEGLEVAVTQTSGGLDGESVRRSVRGAEGGLKTCFAVAREEREALKGAMRVELTLGPAGAVTSAAVIESDLKSRPLERCVLKIIRGLEVEGLEDITEVRLELRYRVARRSRQEQVKEKRIFSVIGSGGAVVDVLRERDPAQARALEEAFAGSTGITDGGASKGGTSGKRGEVVFRKTMVTGPLDHKLATLHVRTFRGDLERCYEAALDENKKLAGPLKLTVQIGGDGRVTKASASSKNEALDAVASCARKAALRWRFPKEEEEEGAATMTLSLDLGPKEVGD